MDAFQEVQDQIDWAKTNIETGFKAFDEYVKNGAFSRVVEDDLKTGEKVGKIKLVKRVPNEVKGPFRNAILDLKHSFDMALHASAKTLGFHRFDKTYPWSDTENGLRGIIESRQRNRDAKLPQILIDEIWRQKPYASGPKSPSGEYLIREIANMANGKHTIGLTVAAKIESYEISQHVRIDTKGGAALGGKWDPEKKELELYRASGDAAITDNNASVTAYIFFKRVGSAGQVPVNVAAETFADYAQLVLDGFKAVCAGAI